MYKIGTGDFFLLKVIGQDGKSHFIIIDCGSYNMDKELLNGIIDEIFIETKGTIDLLIVTHEHADHIKGFSQCSDKFSKLKFKKIWFAWTEDINDQFANELREQYVTIRLALNEAAVQLSKYSADGYFETIYKNELKFDALIERELEFADALDWLNTLNNVNEATKNDSKITMVDKFKAWNLIDKDTIVEFKEPGEVIETLEGISGIRCFILGPPKDLKSLNDEGRKEDYYPKRENPSSLNTEFISALTSKISGSAMPYPFKPEYLIKENSPLKEEYFNPKSKSGWRRIDSNWLMNAGELALRFERCLNNTSLVFAIQIQSTEHILLFPADAEYGNWNSWHNALSWEITDTDGNPTKINAEYIIKNTVFYKVGHHLSHNGTPQPKGLDLMNNPLLTAFVPLDMDIISNNWKNTMPSDLLGASLIEKTKGKVYFSGNRQKIINNIKTNRVTINKRHITQIDKINRAFDDKPFVEVEIV